MYKDRQVMKDEFFEFIKNYERTRNIKLDINIYEFSDPSICTYNDFSKSICQPGSVIAWYRMNEPETYNEYFIRDKLAIMKEVGW